MIDDGGRLPLLSHAESTQSLPIKWQSPVHGRVKLNVDGSYYEASGEAGAGMVLRDGNGAIIFSACRSLVN